MSARNVHHTEGLLSDVVQLDTWSSLKMVAYQINEQYRAIDAVAGASVDIARASDLAADALRGGGRLIYVGAGTSGRLAVLDAAECFPTFGLTEDEILAVIAGGQGALVNSIEGAEDDEEDGRNQMRVVGVSEKDVVCGVAASGTTPFTLAALAYARASGAATVFITCDAIPKNKQGGAVADVIVHLDTGAEVISGSTRLKAGTAQKIALNTISTTLAILLNKVYGGLMVDVVVKNAKLVRRARSLVQLLCGLDEDKAQSLLERADMNVKKAVVMHYASVDRQAAEEILKRKGGSLRAIIGDIDYVNPASRSTSQRGNSLIVREAHWVSHASRWLADKVEQYDARRVYVPAGETLRPLYAKWRASPPDVLQKLTLYQVDEIVEGDAEGCFAQFFVKELPKHTVHPPSEFTPADLAILGLGMNGHVAFHEPGVPLEFNFGNVLITPETATQLEIPAGTLARTYGVAAFLKTRAILLVVVGERKRDVFKRFMERDRALLASALWEHSDLTVLTDIDTAL